MGVGNSNLRIALRHAALGLIRSVAFSLGQQISADLVNCLHWCLKLRGLQSGTAQSRTTDLDNLSPAFAMSPTALGLTLQGPPV